MDRVHVLATGGTIASTMTTEGTVPTESIHDLADTYGDVFDVIDWDVTVEQCVQQPSSELELDDLTTVARRVNDVAGDADAIVVLHGTDTLEETAYYLDLVAASDVPLVLTGSQRTPTEPSADGPANLRGALAAATHDAIRDGAYVFFNDRLHAARPVTKVHSTNPAAYDSGQYGLVAERTPDGLWFFRRPTSLSVSVTRYDLTASVDIVATSTGTTGGIIDDAVERSVDGLIVDGFGLGNVPNDVARAIERAIDHGVPVAVTTRCRHGNTAGVYGSTGGGRTLRRAGAVLASNLSASKARLKLLATLADPGTDVERTFDPSRLDRHGFTPRSVRVNK
ncbi:L-asparaginase [Halarchaeum rubridurum]|uniref:L-asparaginase n=1 Tax=Halarchaeum rubridurum TaxID=489911 RepID=A0A830G5C7_9EURY|nr:asparaginase [Halarchaeum rubridurum]MBP1956019.1 L-asparaginase [Halarchaeum rubridurum]GGM77107.1 L-asparaginase [Halarchaeum rubridurum]